MNGEGQFEHGGNLALWHYGEQVRDWQKLARKYRQEGLSSEEAGQLWSALRQKKTNVDLILEVTMKSPDWQQASREVKVFLDRLASELGSEQISIKKSKLRDKDAPESTKVEKVWERYGEGQLRREIKQSLIKEYQLEKNLAVVDDLARALVPVAALMRDSVDFKQEIRLDKLVKEPRKMLSFVEKYLRGKTLVVKGSKSSFQSLRLLLMGK
jgi:hypothetical protein